MMPSSSRCGAWALPIRVRRGLLVSLVALVSCSGGSSEGYGSDGRDDFVDDCATDGISTRTCGCFYDRLAAEVPYERFERLDEELRADQSADAPTDLAAFAAACEAEH
jgi:hypothetical protein